MLSITFNSERQMTKAKGVLENYGYEVEMIRKEYILNIEGSEQNIINTLLDYEIQFDTIGQDTDL